MLVVVGWIGCLGAMGNGPHSPQASVPVIYVEAEGVGRPPRGMTGPRAHRMARRAAEVRAARNLTAKLSGAPARHHSLRAVVRGHEYTAPRVLPDGTVILRARIRRP